MARLKLTSPLTAMPKRDLPRRRRAWLIGAAAVSLVGVGVWVVPSILLIDQVHGLRERQRVRACGAATSRLAPILTRPTTVPTATSSTDHSCGWVKPKATSS